MGIATPAPARVVEALVSIMLSSSGRDIVSGVVVILKLRLILMLLKLLLPQLLVSLLENARNLAKAWCN